MHTDSGCNGLVASGWELRLPGGSAIISNPKVQNPYEEEIPIKEYPERFDSQAVSLCRFLRDMLGARLQRARTRLTAHPRPRYLKLRILACLLGHKSGIGLCASFHAL